MVFRPEGSTESGRSAQRESRERPEWSLVINVQRHSLKEGAAGALSPEGREQARTTFEDAYEGVALDVDPERGVDIVSSPIPRAEETARIYSNEMERKGVPVRSFTIDDRLTEGQLAQYEEKVTELGGRSGKWIAGWMALDQRPMPEVKTGKETAADFAAWVLERIDGAEREGGAGEVDAFTHGPVMAAFLLTLEERTGQSILPDNWMELSPMRYHLFPLSSFNISVDAKNPKTVRVSFAQKHLDVPLATLEDIADQSAALAAK